MTKIKETLLMIIMAGPLAVLPLLAWNYGQHLPGWILMWLFAFALYTGCKFLTLLNLPVETGLKDGMVYFLFWPGMDPGKFLRKRETIPPFQPLETFAARNVLLGSICLGGIAPLFLDCAPLLAGWVGMTGLIFMLHFGVFHLLALGWQRKDYGAEPIMNRPHMAASLSDFWGKRWNRAFQCLTKQYVFRPLTPHLGAVPALGISFLLSGLIHEFVITLPSGGGYGGPTVYFLLQGFGVVAERSFHLKNHRISARIWTLSMVLLPAGLLFPPAFVRNIILPMFTAWGIFPTS